MTVLAWTIVLVCCFFSGLGFAVAMILGKRVDYLEQHVDTLSDLTAQTNKRIDYVNHNIAEVKRRLHAVEHGTTDRRPWSN